MGILLITLLLFYVLMPMGILYACRRWSFLDKLGPVIIAYIIGIILGNAGILPSMGNYLHEQMVNRPDLGLPEVKEMLETGTVTDSEVLAFRIYKLKDILISISILLAIPLMLFSTNVRQWKEMAGKTVTSLFLGLFSIIAVVTAGYFLFRGSGLHELWKISGLLVGVYTGGTPNLAALKLVLDVDSDTYILVHTYDLIVGVAYLSFVLSVGPRWFRRILPPFPTKLIPVSITPTEKTTSFFSVLEKNSLLPLLKAVGISVLIVALGVGLGELVPKNIQMAAIVLGITSLGILTSFIRSINKIENTFETGMYLILIFSMVVASMADIRNLTSISPALLGYIALAVFGSLFLHLLLSKLFKIDADTALITSVAMVCSPPFVPLAAASMKNRQILISGISIGIIGYAVGNYLGFLLANVLQQF
ncbi:DUF819 family protein [Mariniradius sediminis]|uniref:DUF819 family protein n=1 Tax=Mariniradius sediminis TaxID=2909237 RepID=A0ABS9BTN3_9BACT|nr:DUF819 family protein [Mariniradius sediminis]MCF1751412.1 DUF819 family protein [Mariniradius sediminis]